MDNLISTTKAFFVFILFLGLCFSADHSYAQELDSPWRIGLNYSKMSDYMESSIPEYKGLGIQIERKLINRFSVGSELNFYSQQDYTRTDFGFYGEFQRQSAGLASLYLKGDLLQVRFVTITLKTGRAWFRENYSTEGLMGSCSPSIYEFTLEGKRKDRGIFASAGIELTHKQFILFAEPSLIMLRDANFTGFSVGSKVRF
jgi:hypothetical protein